MANIRLLIQDRLPAGSFARNVLTLMTGTTLSQALMILVAPILTRLYSPEDFGINALYLAILAILAVVACWRYELAIVLPEKDEDAANLLFLSIIICFGMATLTLVLVALFRSPLVQLLGAPELVSWLWFLPISLIATGLFQAFNYWSTRRRHFKRLAVRQITVSIVTSTTQIGVCSIHRSVSAGGLIGGAIVGQIVATSRLAWQVKREEGKFIKERLSSNNLKRVFMRYKKFPIYDTWSGLLNTASTMMPVLLLGYFFTPAVVGYYALGQRVLTLPMGVVGGSVAQVFFPRAIEARKAGDLDRLALEMFKRLLAIGFVPILLISIVAPELFALIFGYQWRTAGEYLRWMSLWLLFVFISSPLSTIYTVMEKQREMLVFNIVMFITRLFVIIIGGIYGDDLFTIALFSFIGVVLYMFNFFYIQHLAGVSALKIIKAIIQQVYYGIPYAALPLTVWFGTYNSMAFVVAGITSGIIFVIAKVYQIKKDTGVIPY